MGDMHTQTENVESNANREHSVEGDANREESNDINRMEEMDKEGSNCGGKREREPTYEAGRGIVGELQQGGNNAGNKIVPFEVTKTGVVEEREETTTNPNASTSRNYNINGKGLRKEEVDKGNVIVTQHDEHVENTETRERDKGLQVKDKADKQTT